MTDLENRVNNLERQQTGFEVKFEMYMQRIDEQMRQQKERMDKFEDKHEEDMREIRAELKSIGRHVQNLTLTAMAAIGAMGVSVVAFIWTIISTK